ncbi:MAG: hypothetical protein ACP5VS_08775 [Desulfomonilaceae bacterium]
MNRHLGILVGRYRQSQGLNFRELAILCRLNPRKWATRLCNFEREGLLDSNEIIQKLIGSLDMDFQQVKAAISRDYEEWEAWANEPVPMELIIQALPGIYRKVKIPEEIKNHEDTIRFAGNLAKQRKTKACLVLNRKESVYFWEDGTLKFKTTTAGGRPHIPHTSVGNRAFYFGDLKDE